MAGKEIKCVGANSLSLVLYGWTKDPADSGPTLPLIVNVFPAPAGLARPWFTYNEQSHQRPDAKATVAPIILGLRVLSLVPAYLPPGMITGEPKSMTVGRECQATLTALERPY